MYFYWPIFLQISERRASPITVSIIIPFLALHDASLRFADQELNLFIDSEMFLFMEYAITGLSVVSHRFAKANNPFVLDYDKHPHSFFTYVDASNL